MAEQEPLSDFWRVRQSDDLPEELVNILNGARGYVGFFGSDFSVDWGKGDSASISKRRIELNYSPLLDKTPPFDGNDVDLVMGTAIHESGHAKWSYPKDDVKKHYAKKRGYYVPTRGTFLGHLHPEEKKEVSELETVANIIEDFYVENKISETYPTLGAYLREARKLSANQELPHNLLYDLTTDNPSFDSLLTMWGAIALIDKTIPENASKKTKKFLNKLINYTLDAGKANSKKRLRISYQIWNELKALDRANKREQERYKNILKQEQEQKQEQEEQPSDKGAPSSGGEPEEPEPQEKDKGDGDDKSKETQKEEETEQEEKPDTEKSREENKDREAEEEPKIEEDKTDSGIESDTEDKEKRDASENENEEESISTSIEEDLSEPYQDHEQLRDCYSINLDDKESMPQALKDTVDDYLERKPEDITQQVSQMLGGAGGKEIVMELAPSNPTKAHKLMIETRRTAQKVSQLFMQDKKLRTRYRRGLLEGAVDPRRLHKAGASDYKLFERKEVLSTPSLAIGVLVDASGSMSYGRIDDAIKTAMALKTALTIIDGVDLMIMAYNTDVPGYHSRYSTDRYTTLHRIYDRKTGEFRPDVRAAGGTPSGYAIAGMVSQIGRYLKGRDKLIIHLTDGAPKSHVEVAQAVDYCLQNKIEVMTLTLAQFHDEIIESYRGLCEHLDSIDKLPDAIASLLKKRLQRRMMRIK